MNRPLLLSIFLLLVSIPSSAATSAAQLSDSALPDAETLLQRSIAYHDPQGQFLTHALLLELKETRPNGADRRTDLKIDVADDSFALTRHGEITLAAKLDGEQCRIQLDGRDASAEALEPYRMSCERLPRMRNYYVYLWGLPMKLQDPGTRLDPVVRNDRFQEQPVLALRVTYDETVGKDIWYFYFDPTTYALVGYRFYHDEAKNDGEYIVLEGELAGAGIRLPQHRSWYTHQDDRLLGTDSLEGLRLGTTP